ncbi:unnamed protein product [Rotaria sp. Silwood1]|nr:unnamed protein product [Rotaria sp. Silwood1]CAF1682905.1 unnamed protein product [Rotaria sp. Silwood1]CAF3915146.1 unnamed protein product [Rotaria sp. Silwood1]CAF5082291.1 unnamed protein product [Rotaria sp. Silwood1]
MPVALVVHEQKKLVVEELSLPKYGSKELLIKVTHVAQNPTDWKHVHFGLAKPGSIVGCDFSGIVVKVGKEAIGNYKKGERVAGCVHGGLDRELGIRGAFSEYVVQEASLVFRYPSTMSPEAVVTLPLASITAALGIFQEMGLPLPPAKIEANFLVWSGSTSVGQCAIQLAKSIGCFVITTASPARHDYLKGLGADVCFDYRDPCVVSKIKQAAKDDLAYAFDCISEKEATRQVCAALTARNSQLCTVLPFITSEIPPHVKEHRVLMYTIFGNERNLFGKLYKAKPEDKEFAEKFYKLLSNVLLPEGLLKPNRVTKISGGLNGVEEGFKQMMENKVAAEKLVYTLAETTGSNNYRWICCRKICS